MSRSSGSFPLRRALTVAALLSCAPQEPELRLPSGREASALQQSSEFMQALVRGHGNRLRPFRPALTPGQDPRPEMERNVSVVRLSTPWEEDQPLYLQAPEHAWTHLPESPATRRLLLPGEDTRNMLEAWRVPAFAQAAKPTWSPVEGGGLSFETELSGGIAVSFEVLPGDRLFELRFGVTNASPAPLLETWAQICPLFGEFGPLADQEPATCSMLAGGERIRWDAAGQDLGWIETFRDPSTGRLARGCFFNALVEGCADERYPPEAYLSAGVMWLRRTIDAPIVVKSSPDDRRHVVLYSPCATAVMFNALAPCVHTDPRMESVGPGETRWVVLYGLFFEGDPTELLTALAEADRDLRRTRGFLED